MPVIKRGSRVVAAGDAANAFGQATAGQRDTTLAVSRLKQQQQQFQAAQAQRADYDNQRRLDQERSFQLQERRIESQNAASIRNQLGRTSQYGAQVNGLSMIQMATRVSQLDPKAYEEMDQQFDALTGGVFNEQNPPTPEALDAHPKREAIYSLLGSYLAPLEKAADSRAIQKGYQDLEQNVSHMGKDWLETADGVQWKAQLDQAIANANQSGAAFTSARAKSIYDEFQAKFTASIDLHERREFYRDRWAEIARDPKYAAVRKTETWQRARNEMAGMGSSTEPDTKFTKVMTMIDPEFELAAQLGYERGQKEGALGATAAQARIGQGERQARAAAPTNAADVVAKQQAEIDAKKALDSPPPTINADDLSGVAVGLGFDDAERRAIRDEVKASGIPLDDPDAVRKFVQDKLRRQTMSGIYNEDAGKGRYTREAP